MVRHALGGIRLAAWAFVLAASLVAFGCAANQAQTPESDMEGIGNQDTLLREPLNDPPNYALFHKSLEFYEQKLGVRFYKNANSRYMPYASSTWRSFSIADSVNDCLYDMNMKGLVGFRSLEGKYNYIIEMSVERGPCGIVGAEADSEAKDKVYLMESSVTTPAVKDQLSRGINVCSGERFLQDVLQLPWKVRVRGEGLENAVGRVAEEIKSPGDIAYGDVVFFTEYYGERSVGLYVDYGVIVYNSCFRANARRLSSDVTYRIYRFYTGFGAIRYKMDENVFMKEIIGRPDL